MAIEFIDGFAHYNDNTHGLLKWPLAFGNTQWFNGRFDGSNGSIGAKSIGGVVARRALSGNLSTVTWGCALLLQGLPGSGSIWNFGPVLYDGTAGGGQITLGVNSSGLVSVYRFTANSLNVNSGAKIGDTSQSIAANQWYYFEMSVTFATGATGSVTVKQGGTTVGTWSSVQTASTANAYANQITLEFSSSGSTWCQFDDLYICNTSGSTHTGFCGEQRISTVYPTGNGRLTQWGTQVGGTGGSPWTAVNQTNPDDDTSYIADSTAGDIEDFTIGSVGTISALTAVQVNVDARKDDTSAHVLGVGVGNGTTENFDAGTTMNSTYQMINRTLDTNPLTSAAWATGDLSTLQAAVKVIS